MSSPAKSATAPDAAPTPSYDPVALAESLRSAAEKSAKLIGDFASRQAASGPSLVADELGIGKAFMELAAKMMANPTGSPRRR
jgi:polyhydroxyalkanoate synthase